VGILNRGRLVVEDTIENLSKIVSDSEGMSLEFKLDNATPELLKELEAIDGVTQVSQQNDRLFVNMSRDIASEVSKTIMKHGAVILLMKPREYSLEEIFMKYYKEAR
jgi:ABC-2 type transport system ATP-binding protein